MKKAIPFLIFVLFITAGCNSQNAEDAVNGYVSETLKDFKDGLPNELKQLDSLINDSTAIKRKIAETTNLDSLKKYKELLKEAKNGVQKDISSIDSVGSEIKRKLEFN
ncbi:hypothetical protein [Pedobacter immunditicola]|uniref:hypothetical protein n=1 Tax=Pedobacter immunditicola TaxID=3133440 RepID=UPI0030B284BC